MATILDNAAVLVLNLKCTKGFWIVALIFHRYYVLECTKGFGVFSIGTTS